jgi:hypothetical protein
VSVTERREAGGSEVTLVVSLLLEDESVWVTVERALLLECWPALLW